jgi:hypothetical protein
MGRFWRQVEQGADCAASLCARAQFQHLAEQYQHRDDRGSFKINRDRTIRHAKAGWEYSRRKRRNQAMQISGARSEGNQAENVQAAVHDRRPGAFEEGQPGPQDDWGCQNELNPGGDARRDKHVKAECGNVAPQFRNQNRQGQRQPDPEATAHVRESGIRRDFGCRLDWLQRHAANRAIARLGLADLCVHKGWYRRRQWPEARYRPAHRRS